MSHPLDAAAAAAAAAATGPAAAAPRPSELDGTVENAAVTKGAEATVELGTEAAEAAAAKARAARSAQNHLRGLAERLYTCMSSVIVGDSEPSRLLPVLEDFILLDPAIDPDRRAAHNALHALRTLLLCVPELHRQMLLDVHEQLLPLLPPSLLKSLDQTRRQHQEPHQQNNNVGRNSSGLASAPNQLLQVP